MSIPLDRLYHYIESVAQDVRQDNVLIYRFSPHGSKKLEDLNSITQLSSQWIMRHILPQVLCYDQEPLDYDYYCSAESISGIMKQYDPLHIKCFSQEEFLKNNLRWQRANIYDKCILLHSEQRSTNLLKYINDQYLPVYYWSHALISLDWFRYAQHQKFQKETNGLKKFLIYNRAWSGTREYRLKFLDMLIDYELVDQCKTWCNPVEPDLQLHYQDYQFTNLNWKPVNHLDLYFQNTVASSLDSADFDITDYTTTDIEIVLETLFDDSRLHLTEKSLRPIACGQPFILCATHGSLQYLKNYGFKTFDNFWDESYDQIVDPVKRMHSIMSTMQQIAQWSEQQRIDNLKQIKLITDYNKQHFFSTCFFNSIIEELKTNLKHAFNSLEVTNTSKKYIEFRKKLCQDKIAKESMIRPDTTHTLTQIQQVLTQARAYYNRYLKTLNK